MLEVSRDTKTEKGFLKKIMPKKRKKNYISFFCLSWLATKCLKLQHVQVEKDNKNCKNHIVFLNNTCQCVFELVLSSFIEMTY